MESKLNKYKLVLWISGMLPFLLFNAALPISEPRTSNLICRFVYIVIVIFAGSYLFYRIKVKNVKVFRGVIEAFLIILLYPLLLFIWVFILLFAGLLDFSGIQ